MSNTAQQTLKHHPALIATLATLALAFALVIPAAAFPAPVFASTSNGCYLTEDDRAAYEADGTLAQRQAYMETMGHSSVDSSLLQSVIARENGMELLSGTPSNWGRGVSTVGTLDVALLHIEFPDMPFADDDTPQALLSAAIGEADPTASTYPYESLNAFYQRSSYGKLSVTAQVLTYTAAHNRDYYTSRDQLIHEAVQALDETVDFSQFDGNNDGYIDGVYAHVSGDNTGWGSLWWSYTWHDEAPLTVDGVQTCSLVTLTTSGADLHRTICHETGHVLGLPDLYSYNQSARWRTGCLSWDLMENQGDPNAYFKWLLGWVDSSQITRLVANQDGITVTRNGQVLQQVSGEAASVDVPTTALNLSATECGGFVVVSNKDEGMFANYYVLEYTAQGQNNQLGFQPTEAQEITPLDPGFRIWRVQGKLTENGTDYLNSNTNGTQHNLLLEMLDVDQAITHPYGSWKMGVAPAANYVTSYGCFLTPGNTLSPTTNPSTNFNESLGSGFTGLTFTTVETEDTAGTMRIGYDSSSKPSPEDFRLELEGTNLITPYCHLTFKTSWPVKATSEYERSVYLEGPGMEEPLEARYSLDGDTVTCMITTNQSKLTAGENLKLTFPEGSFILVTEDGQDVTSPAYTFDVTVGPLANVTSKVVLDKLDPQVKASVLSSVAGPQQTYWAMLQDDGTAILISAPSDGLAQTTSVSISVPELAKIQCWKGGASLYYLGEDLLALRLTTGDSSTQWLSFFNLASEACLGSFELPQGAQIATSNTGCLFTLVRGNESTVTCYAVDDQGQSVQVTTGINDGDAPLTLLASNSTLTMEDLGSTITLVYMDWTTRVNFALNLPADKLQDLLATGNFSLEDLQAAALSEICLGNESLVSVAALPGGGIAVLRSLYDQVDGKWISYNAVYGYNAQGNVTGGVRMDSLGANYTSTNITAYQLVVSPSGTHLAFTRGKKSNLYDPIAEIIVVSLDELTGSLAEANDTPNADASNTPNADTNNAPNADTNNAPNADVSNYSPSAAEDGATTLTAADEDGTTTLPALVSSLDCGRYVYCTTTPATIWTGWCSLMSSQVDWQQDGSKIFTCILMEIAAKPAPDPDSNPKDEDDNPDNPDDPSDPKDEGDDTNTPDNPDKPGNADTPNAPDNPGDADTPDMPDNPNTPDSGKDESSSDSANSGASSTNSGSTNGTTDSTNGSTAGKDSGTTSSTNSTPTTGDQLMSIMVPLIVVILTGAVSLVVFAIVRKKAAEPQDEQVHPRK